MSPHLPKRGNNCVCFASHGEHDTDALGAALASVLVPGTVGALIGPLGSGKTRLVQSIAVALGVDRREVSSPTFILIREYNGRLPIYHFDTYRLHEADEFLALGAEELMQSEAVCLIEWADRVEEVLPEDRLQIHIQISGPTSREFRIGGTGRKSRAIVASLRGRIEKMR